MGFFSSSKPKVIKGRKGNSTTFNVSYAKLGGSKGYKKELLQRIIGSSVCLVIINSKLMYQEQAKKYDSSQHDVLRILDDLRIDYKIMSIKRKADNKLFGFSMTQGESKFYHDKIIGFLLEGQAIEAVGDILDQYNLTYYIDSNDYGRDEVLEKLEGWFDDEELLKREFRYFVFDDNYLKQLVLHCKDEDAEGLSDYLLIV